MDKPRRKLSPRPNKKKAKELETEIVPVEPPPPPPVPDGTQTFDMLIWKDGAWKLLHPPETPADQPLHFSATEGVGPYWKNS